jgi:hypothetical protein
MSATETEIQIDIDAPDEDKDQKGSKTAPNVPNEPEIELKTDDAVQKPAAAPAKVIVSPEEGLEKLKKQLEDEKSARAQADQRAADAERRAADASAAELAAKTDSQENQLHLLTTAIDKFTQANDLLTSKYAEALAAQDFPAAAKINLELSGNAAKLLQLENGKQQLEKAPKPTARPITDPVEAFAAQLTPRSASWIRQHPECVRDPKLNRKMLRAHEDALDEGIKPESDEYFQYIERNLNPAVTRTQDDDPMKDAAQPARRSTPASAPVSRSGNGNGSKPNTMTLTKDEQEMAFNMFPESKDPLKEYARNKYALEKEGKLTH